jgi:hypothetical protein
VNDYPAMIDQVNHVEPVPQQVRARLADEPTGTAPAAAAVHGQAGPPAGGGDLTDELIATDWWTDAMLTAAGIPVIDVPLVTVGGGIGPFVTIDYLRIAGVPTDRIRVLSDIDVPWQTYEYLTRVSQIPRKERIRSDSASRPDNIWGFPSYARQRDSTETLRSSGRSWSSPYGLIITPRAPVRCLPA